VTRFVFSEDGEMQDEGGMLNHGYYRSRSVSGRRRSRKAPAHQHDHGDPAHVLDHELAVNPRVLVFGEDVGPKGGVHGVTLGLAGESMAPARVFDTSLSEEGIIGRAVGMALAGTDAGAGDPVPQICRTRVRADQRLRHDALAHGNNRFAAPMVVRMPVGFFKCGDPWHARRTRCSSCTPGWRVAVPSNAEDAVGLLRGACAAMIR
jgi:2-oxoisovalerate dehydrogenase E1 component